MVCFVGRALRIGYRQCTGCTTSKKTCTGVELQTFWKW